MGGLSGATGGLSMLTGASSTPAGELPISSWGPETSIGGLSPTKCGGALTASPDVLTLAPGSQRGGSFAAGARRIARGSATAAKWPPPPSWICRVARGSPGGGLSSPKAAPSNANGIASSGGGLQFPPQPA